jgi:hypothetical protein
MITTHFNEFRCLDLSCVLLYLLSIKVTKDLYLKPLVSWEKYIKKPEELESVPTACPSSFQDADYYMSLYPAYNINSLNLNLVLINHGLCPGGGDPT